MGLRYGDVPANLVKPSYKRPNRPYSEWWLKPRGTSLILPYTMIIKSHLYETSLPTDSQTPLQIGYKS